MKNFFLAGLLLSSFTARADFHMGGELVNPRSVPHVLETAQVMLSIPEAWAVEVNPEQIAASDFVLASSDVRATQIRLQNGSPAVSPVVRSCIKEILGNSLKTSCMTGAHSGIVYLERDNQVLATLEFREGNLIDSRLQLSALLRSLRALE